MSNVLDVNSINTTITGPLVVNGTVSEIGFSGYAASSSVTAKENLLIVVAPLVKVAAGANTQLSLDTAAAAYNVGSLSASGQILCGNIGAGSTALTIQNLAGAAIAQFWNGTLLHATLNGSMAVASTVHLNGDVVVAGTLSGTGITVKQICKATSCKRPVLGQRPSYRSVGDVDI